ncbi:PAS domain S-box protein [Roseibium sp.]|uniref:PAS domain S-box protein n=1 Tax=Roseibium sp. TaxID=1936156 RepID=UPI003D12403D
MTRTLLDKLERDRLAELESFAFVENEPQSIFDDVTNTLTALFNVDIAFVCFVGREKQRFMSEIGLNIPSAPREDSFCSHAIRQDEPLCVFDAERDGRFCKNPAVVQPPNLRFYAGAPLITSRGHRIGTVSIAGCTPREMTEAERKTLSAMARLVVHQLENQKKMYERDAETRRLKSLLDDITNVMTEGLALYDSEDRLIFMNKRYQKYYDRKGDIIRLGRKFEEMLRDNLRDGYFVEARGREEDWLRERLKWHANPPEQPFEQRLSSGEWVLVSEKKLPEGGTIGVRSDITALKEKERGIRESEQRFKDYTQTASDWIWETDENNRMSLLAGNHWHLSGIEKRAVLGKTRNEVASEDTSTPKWQQLDAAIRNEQPFRDFVYRLFASDGREQVISISGVPVHGEDGTFKGYRGTGRNITDQVRANERLQAAEARIRAALNNTLVGIILIDAQGTVLEFNREAERMFQYSADEIVGGNVSRLMPQETGERHDSFLRNYLETGEAHVIGQARRMTGRRKDGSHFPFTVGISKVELAGGIQFIGSLTDLTEQESLENQLQRAQKLEAIGQLTGGIAHDFNNILGIIKGNLELGLRKAEAGSPLTGYFEKAHRATERATRITQQLLSFSRQKDFYSQKISCDLNQAVHDVEALLQGSMTKSIDLKVRLHSRPLIAHVDMGDLQDAVINLAVNARDAMNSFGVLSITLDEVEVEAASDLDAAGLPVGRYGVVCVTDNGPGIAEDIRGRIFEPFFTTKPKGQGTGLGLAMVYGSAKRSRGEIKVDSQEGFGTCFRIFIPIFDEASTAATDGQTEDSPAPGGTEAILIVDDEPELARYARITLQELGYDARTCTSPQEALDALREGAPVDLVFTDVVMPGPMNGLELVSEVKQINPDVKILLTSGFAGEILAKHDHDIPALLVKPYDRTKLARAIRKSLDDRSAHESTGLR